MLIIKTDRLILRQMSMLDYDAVARMMGNLRVMYAWGHAFNADEVAAWIEKRMSQYAQVGYDYLLAIRAVDGVIIGQIGLLNEIVNNHNFLGVGYIIDYDYWGEGYATEGARAIIDYAKNTLDADEVIATIRPENIASIAVATRLGMRKISEYIKCYNGIEMLHVLYSTRDE